jgi:hypothetical protein
VATADATGIRADNDVARGSWRQGGLWHLVTAADNGERPYLLGMMADVESYV